VARAYYVLKDKPIDMKPLNNHAMAMSSYLLNE
jgi:hypothetical protein